VSAFQADGFILTEAAALVAWVAALGAAGSLFDEDALKRSRIAE
jgi:hypothetical protein